MEKINIRPIYGVSLPIWNIGGVTAPQMAEFSPYVWVGWQNSAEVSRGTPMWAA